MIVQFDQNSIKGTFHSHYVVNNNMHNIMICNHFINCYPYEIASHSRVKETMTRECIAYVVV